MKTLNGFLGTLYRHPFVRYLAVGGTTFVLDFGILFGLHSGLDLNLAGSTSVAYWISILFNFAVTRYWTFSVHEKEGLKRHITAYMVVLVVNYLFTVMLVSIAGEHINFVIAKAIAVLIQMAWTFPIYKYLIFTADEKETSETAA